MINKIKYELMTEDKGKIVNSLIHKAVLKYFDAFTIQKQIGYWNGDNEKSQTIIIITYAHNKYKIRNLCEKIKSIGKQGGVLLTETKVKTEFI